MVLFRVHLRVLPVFHDRVVKSLLHLLGPTRAIKGCMACGTYVDVEDENALVYTEEWETQEALDQRLRAEDLKVLLSAVDLAPEPPVVRFDTISGTHGMDVIVAARSGSG